MGNVCSSKSKKSGPRNLTLAIVGLDNAGKTVTTKGLQGESLDSVAPTIGFQSAEFTFNGHNITLFDLGGGRRIRDIWKNYFSEVYGLIYVIDSSEPDRMIECQDNLSHVLANEKISGKPVLILGNKQDKAGALDELEICEHLNLEKLVNFHKCPCRVETCSAVVGQGKKLDKSIKDGMTWLLQSIGSMYDKLHLRVEKDVAELKEKQAREKEERRKQAQKNREERERLEAKNGVKPSRDDSDEERELAGDPFRRLDANELMKKEEKMRLEKRKKKQQPSPLLSRRRGSDPEDYSGLERRKESPRREPQRARKSSEDEDDDEDDVESGEDIPPPYTIHSQRSSGDTYSKPKNRKLRDDSLRPPPYASLGVPLGPSPRVNQKRAVSRFYNDGASDDDDDDDDNDNDKYTGRYNRNNRDDEDDDTRLDRYSDRSRHPYDLKPAPSLSPRVGMRGLGAGEEEAENRGLYGRRPLIPLAPLEPLDRGDNVRRKKKKKAKKNQTSPIVDEDHSEDYNYKPRVSPFAPRGWGTPPAQRSMMKASLTPRLEPLKEPDSEKSDSDNHNSFSTKWGLVDDLPELAPSNYYRSRRPNSDYDDDVIT